MFTDRSAQIEWLASLFPAVAPAQGAVTVMFTAIGGWRYVADVQAPPPLAFSAR